LKTLTRAEASHISRFKMSFARSADVSHPNLVALYEFMADGQDWFFTMELVQGINFLEYVRPGYQARKVQSSRTPTLRKTSKDPSDELLADYEAETQQLDSDRGNYESSDSLETPEESSLSKSKLNIERLELALRQLARRLTRLARNRKTSSRHQTLKRVGNEGRPRSHSGFRPGC